MDLNLHLCRSKVINPFSLYLTFFNCFRDTLYKSTNRLGVGKFTDYESFLIQFLYLCAHLQHTTSLSVVIFPNVDTSSCLEVWIEVELLSVQITYCCITYLHEVMWKNL